MALYRLGESLQGSISVDGLDLETLSLPQLRPRIAIIPQEPVCFQGTLRFNLDPFHTKTDAQLMEALDRCLLGPWVRSDPEGLGMSIAYCGGNMSLGQQQLICLARAMLNESRLLLLDEATASLDNETDSLVQGLLRKHFADRTVLTIAHRLESIIDSDRILVMDAGKAIECDQPYTLLSNPDSVFAQLCLQTGGQFNSLVLQAKRAKIAKERKDAAAAAATSGTSDAQVLAVEVRK